MKRTLVVGTLTLALVGSGSAFAFAADPPTVDSVLADVAALQCNGTFNADQGQINDDVLTLIEAGDTSSAQLGSIYDARSAKLEELNFCIGTPGVTTTPETPDVDTGDDTPGEDRDCADFATREEAQAALDADPSDPERLDADGNGVACEDAFGGSNSDGTDDVDSTQVDDIPVGGVDTGDGSTQL